MPITINPHARLQVKYRQHALGQRLAPFIIEVSRRLAATQSLRSSVASSADSMPDLAEFFVIDDNVERSFSLKEEYLFSDWTPLTLEFIIRGGTDRRYIDLPQDAELSAALHNMLMSATNGRHSGQSLRKVIASDLTELLDSLTESNILVDLHHDLGSFAASDLPGVYRLQHASLLYRTRTTGVLVDPHVHSAYASFVRDDINRSQLEGKVDAILISHFHEDHWFLASLLMFDPDIPIIVPKVPRSTVICGDMAKILSQYGFRNVIAADWYSEPIKIGDIEVDILPFYGEQPLRFDEPKNAHIRNWGNTYVIRCEYFTSWFLIDSGSDSRGSMLDVARIVKDKYGTIDFILSNLRAFYIGTPLYINGGLNWLTLSPGQISTFQSMNKHCITLGPEGVAAICDVVAPSYFLPYAHWFGNVASVGDVGLDTPGQSEIALLKALIGQLQARQVPTTVIPWKIGDGFNARRAGRFVHAPVTLL